MFAAAPVLTEFQPVRPSRRGPYAGRILISVLSLTVLATGIPSVAAQSAITQSPKTASDPQSLSAQLTAELQLVYRDNVPEITRRSEQLRQATAAWNSSSKSDADRAQMTAWLREAIRTSMPGSDKPLPPTPKFVVAEKQAKPTQPSSPSTPSKPKSDPTTQSAAPIVPSASISRAETSLLKTAAPKETKLQQSATGKKPAEGDPFKDDAIPIETNSHDDRATPTVPKPTPAPQSTDHPVHIRLDELAPRIQGFEMSLRGIDAKLIAGKLSADALADISAQLDQLTDERQFLSLYVGALSPAEQSQLPSLRSLEPATRLLAQRVEERQTSLQSAGTSSTDPSPDEERKTLDELASKLKQSSAVHTAAN